MELDESQYVNEYVIIVKGRVVAHGMVKMLKNFYMMYEKISSRDSIDCKDTTRRGADLMIVFKYRRQKSSSFGDILRPIADVIVEFNGNQIEVPMYIDSGADITLLPFTMGKALGFKEEADEIKQMKGISGAGVPFVAKTISIFLSNERIEAKIAWSMVEDVPPLLGRMDVFPRFKILFDEANEQMKR